MKELIENYSGKGNIKQSIDQLAVSQQKEMDKKE